jgi:hypothetical protein
MGGSSGEEQGRRLFGVSLTDRPRWQQFLFCAGGFFFGYLVNGVCEVSFLIVLCRADRLYVLINLGFCFF